MFYHLTEIFFVVGSRVALPYSHAGIKIGTVGSYVKITAKLGLVAMWNEGDFLTVLFFFLWLVFKNFHFKREEMTESI